MGQQKSEYKKGIINKRTQLNYELFGHKKGLIKTKQNILKYNIFKNWKTVGNREGSDESNLLNNTKIELKNNMTYIKNNYIMLKTMKYNLHDKRKKSKENNIKTTPKRIYEFRKHGNISGIWKEIKIIRKTKHLMEFKNYMTIIKV